MRSGTLILWVSGGQVARPLEVAMPWFEYWRRSVEANAAIADWFIFVERGDRTFANVTATSNIYVVEDDLAKR